MCLVWYINSREHIVHLLVKFSPSPDSERLLVADMS